MQSKGATRSARNSRTHPHAGRTHWTTSRRADDVRAVFLQHLVSGADQSGADAGTDRAAVSGAGDPGRIVEPATVDRSGAARVGAGTGDRSMPAVRLRRSAAGGADRPFSTRLLAGQRDRSANQRRYPGSFHFRADVVDFDWTPTEFTPLDPARCLQ